MNNDSRQTDGVSVHSGFPNPAADKTLANLDLHQLLVQRPASTFLFRIAGNHWHEIGIFDGDIAVIDRALSPHANDIVAWWNETHGEFELSHFKTVPEGGEVFGVVTATVHQFVRGRAQEGNGATGSASPHQTNTQNHKR